MATQAELDAFLEEQKNNASFDDEFKKKKKKSSVVQDNPQIDVMSIEAARELQSTGSQTQQRNLAGGAPSPGPKLDVANSAPTSTIIARPETTSKIDVSADVAKPSALENIPKVVDRFQGQYDAARASLTAFDEKGATPTASDVKNFGQERAQTMANQRHLSSPGRVSRGGAVRRAQDLLKSGSFADNANIREQLRQQQSASARASLSQAELFDTESKYYADAVEAVNKKKKKTQGAITLDPYAVNDALNFD